MSWGLRYRSKWKDIDGNVKVALFYRESYEGEVFDWPLTKESGVRISIDKGDRLFADNPLISTIAEFGFYFSEVVSFDEFIDLDFKVEIKDEDTGNIEFTGLLEPWDSTRPYAQPKHLVSFTATCGLSRLSRLRYSYPSGDIVRTYLQIVWDCLSALNTGLDLITSVHINLVPAPATEDPLKTVAVSIYRYRNSDVWDKMDKVLIDILHKYNAELVYQDNRWNIISRPDQFIGTHTAYHFYEYQQTVSEYFESLPSVTKSFNYSDGLSLNGGTVSLLHAIRKYVVNLDAGEQREFFPNGDFQQFIGGVFPEWDLSKMPNSSSNGWHREATADEDYPNLLKISGTRPTWIEKKKSWLPILRKKVEVEPEEYVQSPIGKFNPGIDGVTVEFEYICGTIKNFGIAIGFWDSRTNSSPTFWINGDPVENREWSLADQLQDKWGGIVITPTQDTNIGGNINPRYRFTASLMTGYWNALSRTLGGDAAWQIDRIVVRFYKVVNEDVTPGQDWYRIFWLKGREGVENSPNSGSTATGQYSTEFQVGGKDKDEEGQTIDLITGEYVPGFNGTLLRPDGSFFYDAWRRPGIDEEIGLYPAFVEQRLWMTWRHLMVIEARFKLKTAAAAIKYLDLVYLEDLEKTFQITRIDWDDYLRTADIRLVELSYSEPVEDIKRDAYNITENGKSSRIKGADGNVDRVYPPIGGTTGNSGARESFDDLDQNTVDNFLQLGILPSPFKTLPTFYYVRGIRSTVVENLEDYFNEAYLSEENEHSPEDFLLSVKSAPIWLNIAIDELEISGSGKSDTDGEFLLTLSLLDVESELTADLLIRAIVLPSPSLTYTLNSTKLIPSQPVTLPHAPPYTLTVQTKGGHDAYRWVHRFAGAVQYDSDIIPVAYTETATYAPISAASLAQGIHVVFFQLFRQTGVDENDDPIYTAISGDDLIFKLGTTPEDPYRTVKLELMAGGVPVGEIPNTFAYIEEWDIRPTPTGIKYDELFLSVLPEEEPYTNTLTPTLTGVSFGLESEILDGSNGATSPDAGYQTTDAIPVVAGQEFWLGSAPYSAAGYNSGSFVTELSGEVLTIPAGVNQIRICWANGSLTDVSLAELIGTLFGGDAPKGAGNFTVFVRARFGGSQEYERMAELIVLEKEPEEPIEQEGITLIQPGNPLVKLVDPLPIEGAVIPLPPAFGLLFSGFGAIQYDKIAWKLFQGISGMSEVSLPMYTGQPSEKSYGSPVTAATQLLFWGKDSTEIGTIHQAPNRFLAEVIATLKGEKVAIAKADWIFSNTPIGPGTGMTYGYYDPSAQVLSTMVPDVPATGGIYKLVKLAGQGWVVGALTWNSSTQYNKVETEVNGVIVHTWTGALKSSNTVDESFDWNRSVPGLDEPGEKTIKQRFYNGVTLIGTKQATITFYPEDPEIKDPNECCSGGGDSEGISVTIGNGTDNLYGIPHPYGDRPLVVSVYRASDMAQTYPGIRTPTGMVWVSFKSPLAVNARIVVIRPI